MLHRSVTSGSVWIALIGGLLPVQAQAPVAADLHPRASQAYEAHAEAARRDFIDRASRSVAKPDAPITAAPGRQDGIIGVPGGLVHHWTGSGFIRGITLQQALDASRDYSTYPSVYRAVKSVRVLEEQEQSARVLMRLHESAGGLSAVLDVRSTVHYARPGPGRGYSIATLDEIREVKNAGTPSETLLPVGRDSGYLWRGGSFTLFVEHETGVYVEMETLALSRGFPPMMGWIIEPIARRIGRRSVETSLREFQTAVLKRYPKSSAALAF